MLLELVAVNETQQQHMEVLNALNQPQTGPHATDQSPWPWLFWVLHCMYWGIVATLSLGMSYALTPQGPIGSLSIAFRMVSGFLLTAAVYWFFQQPWLRMRSRLLRWPLMLVLTGSLMVASLALLWISGIETTMIWTGSGTLAQVVPRIAAATFWCTIFFGFELFDGLYVSELRLAQANADIARREAIAYEHEVHRLQAQMNPHFLFNALNAVIACRHNPNDVARVTQDLADFLRSGLRDPRLLEPLWKEIDNLGKYLAVQQARFGEKLICRIVCERTARNVMVPPMMIQPLLENAISYGMQTCRGPLRVDVLARIADAQLEVDVINSGAWLEPDPERSPGTGLKTLRKRLALLIDSSATVTVETSCPEAWTEGPCVRVVIRLPVKLSEKSRHSQRA
jgi:sensor histidine kinase YesM